MLDYGCTQKKQFQQGVRLLKNFQHFFRYDNPTFKQHDSDFTLRSTLKSPMKRLFLQRTGTSRRTIFICIFLMISLPKESHGTTVRNLMNKCMAHFAGHISAQTLGILLLRSVSCSTLFISQVHHDICILLDPDKDPPSLGGRISMARH